MALTSSSSNSRDQKSSSHRVLARKYRPSTFKDMIGQEPSVQVLTNSIEMNRLPHAILLTGIRGVGKTTIARIIARSLNCIGVDGQGGPTASPCGVCEPCTAITGDRHIDVIEMDAASRTGVEDVREVIEGGRYKAVSARYKVYIIDEIHMLSKNAFNAFLKTLEEPPPHLIFIFATTELNKVPDTIRSRCMRLQLRRIELEVLIEYLKDITHREGMKIDQGAVNLIARAADGSVRDGLSLLDQAMALCEGKVDESSVLKMLGFSDRSLLFNLFVALIQGQPQEALQFFHQMYLTGSDPLMILHDLMDLTHWIGLHKMLVTSASYPGLDEAYAQKATFIIENLSFPMVSRCWQTLLKGAQETALAPSTKQAVEVVLLRLCYLAGLPSIDDVIQTLSEDIIPQQFIEIETRQPQRVSLESISTKIDSVKAIPQETLSINLPFIEPLSTETVSNKTIQNETIPTEETLAENISPKLSKAKKHPPKTLRKKVFPDLKINADSEKDTDLVETKNLMPLLVESDSKTMDLDLKREIQTSSNPESLPDHNIEKMTTDTIKTKPVKNKKTRVKSNPMSSSDSLFSDSLSLFPDNNKSLPAEDEVSEMSKEEETIESPISPFPSFLNVLAFLATKREMILKNHIENYCHLISYEPGIICLRPASEMPKDVPRDLKKFLNSSTDISWTVNIGEESGDPTVGEQTIKKRAEKRKKVLKGPNIEFAKTIFPEAVIEEVDDNP